MLFFLPSNESEIELKRSSKGLEDGSSLNQCTPTMLLFSLFLFFASFIQSLYFCTRACRHMSRGHSHASSKVQLVHFMDAGHKRQRTSHWSSSSSYIPSHGLHTQDLIWVGKCARLLYRNNISWALFFRFLPAIKGSLFLRNFSHTHPPSSILHPLLFNSFNSGPTFPSSSPSVELKQGLFTETTVLVSRFSYSLSSVLMKTGSQYRHTKSLRYA